MIRALNGDFSIEIDSEQISPFSSIIYRSRYSMLFLYETVFINN